MDQDGIVLKIPPPDELELLGKEKAARRFAGLDKKPRQSHFPGSAFKPLVKSTPDAGSDDFGVTIEEVDMTGFFQLYEAYRRIILSHCDENRSTVRHPCEELVRRGWPGTPCLDLGLRVIPFAHFTNRLMKDRYK